MTVKEVAEALGVSTALVYALGRTGKIAHERHGLGRGTIRVSPAALDEYRRGAAARPAPDPAVGLTHIVTR